MCNEVMWSHMVGRECNYQVCRTVVAGKVCSVVKNAVFPVVLFAVNRSVITVVLFCCRGLLCSVKCHNTFSFISAMALVLVFPAASTQQFAIRHGFLAQLPILLYEEMDIIVIRMCGAHDFRGPEFNFDNDTINALVQAVAFENALIAGLA